MRAVSVALMLCLVLGFAACGDDTSAGGGGTESRPKSGDGDGDGPAPVVKLPQSQPPNKLVVKDLEVGKGRAAKPGDELEVYFTSFRHLTGEHFETIWKPDKPFDFKLNESDVIPGWVEGLPGMRVGGRRYLEVPGKLAARGGISPFQDPDESALVYVVDLLEVK
ncbi:MAG TPA: FKBP-type peptidyl-prolyl cis-trans isomerase [Solirubrobacterales bacterium]